MKRILLFMVVALLIFGMVSCDQEVKTKTYKVSCDANGAVGNVPASIEVEEGGTITVPSYGSLFMKGYDFVGWNTKKDGSGKLYKESQYFKVDGNISLYAQWTLLTYSISYDLDGGSYSEGVSNPDTYTVEADTFTLNNPEKDGYEFLGWKTSEGEEPNKNVSIGKGTTGDLLFIAVWRPLNSYSISYDLNGGEGSIGTVLKLEGESAEIATASEVLRNGYGFACWNTESDGTGKDYNPGDLYEEDADLQLYAKWSIVKYSIEYNLNDGKLATGKSNPDEYTVETVDIVLKNPTKYGYEFVGWRYNDDSDVSASTDFSIKKGTTGNLSIVAVWKALDTYAISYDANGGTGTIETQSKYKGESLSISSGEGIGRNGYTFLCWNTKADGTGTDYNPNNVYSADADLRLYAKWNPVKYSIMYELDGGNFAEGSSITEYTIETDTFTIPIPTKTGYVFAGWKALGSDKAQEAVSIEKGSTGDLKFTAVWRKLKRYTVSYNTNGGSGSVPAQTKIEGASIKISGQTGIERSGYTFVCWNTKSDGTGMDYNPSDEYSNDAGLVLYAKWSVVKYSITYDLAGGTLPEGKSNPSGYTIETETFALVNPEKENYEFVGWKVLGSTDDSAVKKVLIENGSTGNRSFVAVWKVVPLAYTYLSETKSYSVKCTDRNVSSVTIPTMYKGRPVTDIEDSAFFNCESLKEITIPLSVTSIGKRAFNNCGSLTSITIPESVVSIGAWAFCGCSGLTSITIPEDVTNIGESPFISCSGLESISVDEGNSVYYSEGDCLMERDTNKLINGCKNSKIPSCTTSIENYAFSGCKGLTKVIIPDCVESIGNNAFFYCSSLEEIKMSKNVASIGSHAFEGCSSLEEITIPKSVTSIGFHAFYGCSRLSVILADGLERIPDKAFSAAPIVSVVIPSSVTSIGDSAFYFCDSLREVMIPSSVLSIGQEAFQRCGKLEKIILSNGLKNIGDHAFSSCNSLREIKIPSSVEVMGSYVFQDCSELSVSFEYGIERIPDWALNGAFGGVVSVKIPSSVKEIGKCAFNYCTGLENITIPDSVTSIGSYAFSNCRSLTNIVIPDGVTNIEDGTFNECSGLTDISIPKSVKSIGKYAFNKCSGLTKITMPNNLKSIELQAFYNCGGLTAITIPSSVTSIGERAFAGCSGLTAITIPSSVKSIGVGAFAGCDGIRSVVLNDYICNNLSMLDLFGSSSCQNIETAVIPYGVTYISIYTFQNCSGLKKITIPASVKGILNWAFLNCKSLTDITYLGKKAQWNSMQKDSTWNSNTGNYTIHCTDGDIAKN